MAERGVEQMLFLILAFFFFSDDETFVLLADVGHYMDSHSAGFSSVVPPLPSGLTLTPQNKQKIVSCDA